MAPDETRQLLGEIAVIDNRKMTPETARTWHDLLNGFTLDQCRAAVRTIRLNQPDLWITPGHIAQVVRNELRDQGRNSAPQCWHGIPHGAHCHDCTGRWADGTEDPLLTGDHPDTISRRLRAHGVVYPGETTCPWGHTIDHDIVTARRRAGRLPTCQDCVA